MGKDRTGKLETMIGVNDKELTTPKHDAMCLWVDKNIHKILKDTGLDDRKTITLKRKMVEPNDPSGSGIGCKNAVWINLRPQPTALIEEQSISCKYIGKPALCPINEFGAASESKECPYWNQINREFLKMQTIINSDELYSILIGWEEPIKGYNGFVIGIPDFTISIRPILRRKMKDAGANLFYTDALDEKKIIIEVKPNIKSIGETMRQLKLYKSYIKQETAILLITQSENIEIFQSQGIKTFILTDDMLSGQ